MKKEKNIDLKEEKFKFFSHKKCEWFPCHDVKWTEDFNCLFCFCPLYALGENCGGTPNFLEDGTKDCSKCLLPHKRESYAYIIDKFDEISELARKK